ncbi:MAG TPA: 4-hydroxythreonine-4-phosphate dehydrogenase PdxA [Gammaproteobacteria bacterium]|jgi:4-hydroxythreonine-4-phosphate dehydrogenase|nr:4-hydroxythreonine-4-phosphate dehydrogenase PdxA [Gammaproteobacteria bacterium]|tara:strand:+ start:281 stop:1270 length:990 start_codon:yes stop_codon:yes gene_type:complete
MGLDALIAVTPGEPAGIGPDLVVQYAQHQYEGITPWVVVADADMLRQRADMLGLPLQVHDDFARLPSAPGDLAVMHIPLSSKVVPGQLSVDHAPGVLAALDRAIAGAMDGTFAALVTGPMQKSVINDAGIPFSGHTEYLAAAAAVDDVVMLLMSDALKVALATTHLPLAAVSAALDQQLLERRLRILHSALIQDFGLPEPKILVAGLNPHAGEDGHLGREEIEVIEPVCEALRRGGMDVIGPLPADTLYTPKYLAEADATMAMFHDQGLPVLKFAGFGRAVNVTLGLPFVRTSVDHGTALDLAASGQADSGSFAHALAAAQTIVTQRTT